MRKLLTLVICFGMIAGICVGAFQMIASLI